MNDPSTHLEKPAGAADSLSEALTSLDAQSKLAESAELARSGHYGEAEELLKTIKDWSSLPPALDLMARISAQQGKVDEAAKYWEAALKLSPSNLSYQSGYDYVTKLKRPVPIVARGLTWLWAAVSVLLVAVIAFLLYQQAGRDKALPPSPNNAQLATLQAQVLGLYITPVPTATYMPTQTPYAVPTVTPGAQELQSLAIDVPGLKTVLSGDALFIYSEKDMFDYTWSLAPDARPMLTAFGHQLEPYSSRVRITLVGFRETSEKSDIFDVGLTRSNVVYSWLHDSTNLPADVFVIMPMETFLGQPYASALKQIGAVKKSVLFVVQLAE